MIIMFSITVTPSISGQYEGKNKNVTFYPIIGFQYTTFHKGIGSKVKVIQCNMAVSYTHLTLPTILRV